MAALPVPALLMAAALLVAAPAALAAQATGTILGQVVSAEDGRPLPDASVELVDLSSRTLSAEDGRFILVGVPPGERAIRVTLLGHQPVEVEGIRVRAGQPVRVDVELRPTALEVAGVTAEVERVRLVEPEVSATHEVVLGTELRSMPVDAVEEAVELAPGVSDGHFRGGRIGQEVYVVDGLEFKNQLEASSQGSGLELPPTALEEVEVVTGGMGAAYGSALSGIVRYTTRRGDPVEWEGRTSLRTDHWAPEGIFRGFTAISASAGGPVGFLGAGTALYADVLLQGMRDADPRARGLTCLEPGDGPDALDGLIRSVSGSGLDCPYTDAGFPHQQGEKYLGFVRLDRPLGASTNLMLSVLQNRVQQQLYTSEFKYSPTYQLGQRTEGTLATVAVDWTRQRAGRGLHLTARGSAMRLDRYLGTLDPWTFDERISPGGFGLSDYRFLGEDFVRSPVEEQLASGSAVPGYRTPGGSTGSPFGPAAEGIFFTEGTPTLANWSRSEFLSGDLVGEYLTTDGHMVRAGAGGKLHRVQNYERVLAHLPGSSPNYARFYPAQVSAFAEGELAALEDVTIRVGGRVEAYRSGLTFREDRGDFTTPAVDTEWQVSVTPRVGVSGPIPGTDGRTAFRFNYGQVAQAPDFQFFLDTSIGDSLRTDIRRQGNPNLTFERGSSFEVGLSQLLGPEVAVSLVGFRKELTNLVSGTLDFAGVDEGQFTTGDFGTVQGAELSLRARWPWARVRASYALQEATGVVSGALEAGEPGDGGPGEGDPGDGEPDTREEFPLAFDRRHAGTVAVFAGQAAGVEERRWGASAILTVASGYPLRPGVEVDEGASTLPERLPWTHTLDLRYSQELGSPPGCGSCTWRLLADARNLLDRTNVVALRRSTGTVGPSAEEVTALVDARPLARPIPRESPRYSARIDLDADGVITGGEYRDARLAAALDRFDPSLFYGEALQLRLGLEVSF